MTRFLSFEIALILKIIAVLLVTSSFFSRVSAAPGPQNFTIMHTNDEHSHLIPHSSVLDYHPQKSDSSIGGIKRLASLSAELENARNDWAEEVLLVSAGDFKAGSPFAWLSLEDRAVELNLMQKTGYDIVTLGNHEFDYGPKALAEYLDRAGYPEAQQKTAVIASNLEIPEGHKMQETGIKRTKVMEVSSELTLGFFGLLGENAELVNPRTEPMEFADRIKTAEEMIDKLKNQGADVIIAITHSGLTEDIELAQNTENLDLIIGGHSHTKLEKPREVDNTKIVQTEEHMKYLGVLDFAFYPDDHTLELKNEERGQSYLEKIDDSINPDENIAEITDEKTEMLKDYTAEVTNGRYEDLFASPFTMDFSFSDKNLYSDTPFGNFFTDALRLGAQNILGGDIDFAFQANGSIRGGLEPGVMPWSEDQISYYELAASSSLFRGDDGRPGSPLVETYLSEREIIRILEISSFLSEYMGERQFFQVSGLRYTYDRRRATLFRIPRFDIPVPTGRSVLSAERYTGEGTQLKSPNAYQKMERGGDKLYRVVTDYYILEYLPEINKYLPFMSVRPKYEDGTPMEDMEDAIVYRNGQEIKVWEVLWHYADMQLDELSEEYRTAQDRVKQEKSFSPLALPGAVTLIFLILLIAAAGYGLYELVV